MAYVWARFSWLQARDEDGKPNQHVRDFQHEDNSGKPVGPGVPFISLCGIEVTPWVEDMRVGACFAPTCRLCTVLLAHAQGWLPNELGLLAGRFEWSDDEINDLLERFGWSTMGVLNFRQAFARGQRETAKRVETSR